LLQVSRLTKQLDHDAFVALFDHLRKVLFRVNARIHNGLVEAYRYTYLEVQVRDTEDNIRLTISSSRSFGAKFLTWANRATRPPGKPSAVPVVNDNQDNRSRRSLSQFSNPQSDLYGLHLPFHRGSSNSGRHVDISPMGKRLEAEH
jgi:hypothetical protein